jgi:acetyltransferase
MTTRNLDALFEPRSIALVGASNTPDSIGAVLARNLLESGFAGPVLAVNPHEQAIRSTLSYRTVGELPVAPDLAVIATPAPTVPRLIADLGARGCRAAVVISAGFGAGEGSLRQAMLDAARPHLLRIVGPNCLGFISPRRGINASFAQLTPPAGDIALVAQSGAITAAALDWGAARGIGFSHVVTIGDAADVDFGDLLDYLALDTATRAILLYVESITDARKFMTAGRIAARNKPVMVIKAGRSAAGAKAAFSHTGALAGSDAVYDAAFRRAGMLRVDELRELFDAAATLTTGQAVSGDRLAILTNGGGAGVMAVDTLEALGGRLAQLSDSGLERLKAALPPHASSGNPVDILGDAKADRYRAALDVLLQEPETDAILVLNCPTAVADSADAARAVVETCAVAPRKRPVFTCWLGERGVAEGRKALSAARIPTHETPDEAIRAFMHLAQYRQNQQVLMQTPPRSSGAPDDVEAARQVIETALEAGRGALTDPEARAVLAAYGVPVVDSRTSPTPEAAGAAAEAIGGAVALKILSHDISHKSDAGGVALNLVGRAVVETAARDMLQRIGSALPHARLDGFIVQPMVLRPKSEELIAGVAQDAVFGPVVLFGQGGVAVEVDGDRAIGLAPLDEVLARDLIGRTRVSRRLAGYRDRPPADLGAVSQALIGLARLAADLPEVVELDINPLLADAAGVLALDARIRIERRPHPPRAAIRPYPSDLVQRITLDDRPLMVRPVRPQDAARLIEMIDLTAPEDVRQRFGAGFRHLPTSLAQRLSQIDYDREMAFVAEAQDGALLGVARLAGDPEGERAEFSLIVRSDWQRRGLGRSLLRTALGYADARGLREVWGDVARDNGPMLEMADAFGFTRCDGEDAWRVRVVKTLG